MEKQNEDVKAARRQKREKKSHHSSQDNLAIILSSLPYESVVQIAGDLLNSRDDSGSYGLDPLWLAHYQQLIHYKAQFGTVNVPRRDKNHAPLAEWCHKQRELFRKKQLAEELIQKLNAVGFDLKKKQGKVLVGEDLWNIRFQQLLQYKRETGTCNVPQIYMQNSSLGNWVSTQRVLFRNNKMPDDRRDRLNEIGFEWTRDKSKCVQMVDGVTITNFDELWEHRFQQLVAYKEDHGDCSVPQFYPQNPSLGIWVDAQRVRQRNGKLCDARVERLNDIGFSWCVKKKSEDEEESCGSFDKVL